LGFGARSFNGCDRDSVGILTVASVTAIEARHETRQTALLLHGRDIFAFSFDNDFPSRP